MCLSGTVVDVEYMRANIQRNIDLEELKEEHARLAGGQDATAIGNSALGDASEPSGSVALPSATTKAPSTKNRGNKNKKR